MVLPLALAAGCGSGGGTSVVAGMPTTTVPTTTTRASTTTSSITMVNGKPHFDTPEAAMTYLAAAWNADDVVSLRHVTDPSARAELDAMHEVATNLELDHCDANEGDYTCHFSHDHPDSVTESTGEAVFVVGPADTPGWYMTVFESCN
ncbi:MAG: hypothetical protein JWO68_1163 [Actinomycetia bacterium]|nr:hypothetical protein [Actinomycetes bacterium]